MRERRGKVMITTDNLPWLIVIGVSLVTLLVCRWIERRDKKKREAK